MAISPLIQIDGNDLPKVKAFTVERNKLWSEADRNMSGDLRATFIGIFPKIKIEFTYTTQAEMQSLIDIFDSPFFTVTWWDEGIEQVAEGQFYAGDYSYSVYSVERELYEPFSVSLIPVSKLTPSA